jgi:putative CocE/NonD family hydrolase
LVGIASIPASALAQTTADVTCHIEYAPMRDGIRLATEVYMPPGPAKYPVIMQRTPYNRNGAATDTNCASTTLRDMAGAGYVVLNQDVRGLYRSEGAFNPMFQEATDGYDAIEWAAAQPWSTGKVGLMSGSYVGLTQWQPAVLTPPHLAAIAPAITASDYHDHWTYVNGVFDLWFGQSWIHATFGREILLRDLLASGLTREAANAQVAAWIAKGNEELRSQWVWQLPLTSFPEFRSIASYYYDWLAHPNYDDYWRRLDIEPRYGNVKVPALNSGAWYDIFQIGTVRNFLGMRAQGGTQEAREGTKLIMTCCGHAGTSGAVSWGPTVNPVPITTQLRFFDRYLKDIQNGVEKDPAVQLYVLNPPDTGTAGSGFWVNSDEYPLPGTADTAYYLASEGGANTRSGNGRLQRRFPGLGPVSPNPRPGEVGIINWHFTGLGITPDRFSYDPANPVPTVGGNMCCNTTLLPAGAHDQSTVETRADVLVYTSEPLVEDLVVIGPVKVVLWAASSATDTDFTAKLVDVHLDGFAHNVLDRIVRARFRQGSKEPPSLIQPEQAYEYTLELGHAGTVFRKGHRIRLEISSSNFPHYARNLNTGLDNNTTSMFQVAHQTVFHDRNRMSRIVLPIVPTVKVPDAAQ